MEKKAYKEVYEILKYVPQEEYNKISKDFINLIENEKDDEYNFVYNPEIDLEEQNLLRETKALLGIIFIDYWATEEEKNRINKKFENDLRNEEIEKEQKFSYENLFKTEEKIKTKERTEIITLEEKWYEKVFKFLKKLIIKK